MSPLDVVRWQIKAARALLSLGEAWVQAMYPDRKIEVDAEGIPHIIGLRGAHYPAQLPQQLPQETIRQMVRSGKGALRRVA